MMMKSKAKAWKKLGEQAVKGMQDGMQKERRLMYPILRNAFAPFRYGRSVAQDVEDDEEVEEEE